MQLTLLLLGVVVLTARLGLCFYLSGLSRAKNAAGGVMRGLIDLCVAVLAFWAVGHAIMSGGWRSLGGWDGSFGAQAFFNMTIVLVATGAALGGTLERTRWAAPLAASAILAGLVVPLAGRWVWRGWLADIGFVDVGGAAVLHLCGGLFAAAGAIVAGPRGGKYNHDGSANLIPGHSVPLAAAGALAMVIGLLAQIAGCAAVQDLSPAAAAAAALLAAAAGGLAGLLFGQIRYAVADAHFVLIGLLAGLVSVSAGAGRLSLPAAVLIGAVGGCLASAVSVWVDLKRKIDDPGFGIAIHVVGAIWGLLAAGLLLPGSYDRLRQLGVQCVGIAIFGVIALIVSLGLFAVIKRMVGLRPSDADEMDGGDLIQHDVNAYPDFHQTMIKSYHLRET